MRYDAVIVGSGVSGLAAGIILARQGRSVLVLEQAETPGGLMQTYQRRGLRFPTGVHVLGSLDEGQILWRYLKYLGVIDRVDLVPMDRDGFQDIRFPGARFLLPHGHRAYRDRLCTYFPDARRAIETYLDDMARTVALFPLYNLAPDPPRAAQWFGQQSLSSYLDALTDCEQLKAVLAASSPLYGVEAAQCPTYLHFLVMDSLLQSAWRVDERAATLAGAFLASLDAAGGEIRSGSRVTGISCQAQAAKGVELEDGSRIDTDLVVFTPHPRHLLRLCPEGTFRPAYRGRLSGLVDAASAFGVAFSLTGDTCSLARRDAYIYTSWEQDAHYEQLLFSDDGSPYMTYCAAAPYPVEGAFPITALCFAHPGEWSRWKDSVSRRRPQEYAATKAAIADRILKRLQAMSIGDSGELRVVDTFSPLTFRDYTLSPNGTLYGIKKSLEAGRSAILSPRTRVEGLVLAGQSLVVPGILGALVSAVSACAAVLGHQHVVRQIARASS